MTSEDIKQLMAEAEQGDATAQNDLGSAYLNGEGVPQNHAEAARWYRLAADQGDMYAQYSLGGMYYKGWGVMQDYAEAAKWFQLAADQGDAEAYYSLGKMYTQGHGVPQNYAQAVKLLRLAAEQGHASAQKDLLMIWHPVNTLQEDTELGVPEGQYIPGASEATKLIQDAIKGDAEAQYSLGVVYDSGLIQNHEKVVKWWRCAAEQGHADAQLNLGLMYDKGEGVSQSNREAYIWFHIAAVSGHEKAAALRDLVAEQMSPADLSSAKQEAEQRHAKIQATS